MANSVRHILKPAKVRHEFKYLCSEGDLKLIDNRLRGLATIDKHTLENGIYFIRSLYFDDIDNTYYYENENGTDPREKFRIRIYNGDLSWISLENKKKIHGKTQKFSCNISEDECRKLMRGEPLPVNADTDPLVVRLSVLMRTRLLRPVTIVEYERTPFVYPEGNVRITFDRNLSSSDRVSDFLLPNVATRPVMPPGVQLLEVKWDEFIPDTVFNSVGVENLSRTAFSKFYLCRKFNLHGGTNL